MLALLVQIDRTSKYRGHVNVHISISHVACVLLVVATKFGRNEAVDAAGSDRGGGSPAEKL